MALKQQQQFKQQQKLSPIQMQVIRLTELPILEFEDKIKQELEENPALEEGEDFSDTDIDTETFEDQQQEDAISQEDLALGDYINDEEIPDYYLPNQGSKESAAEIPFNGGISFQESLLKQLHELSFKDENLEKEIARYIIGSLDENGYLERTLQSISDDFLFQQGVDVPISQLEEVLSIVQTLEPAGVGARNLQECLLLQLQRKPQNKNTELAIVIIKEFFEEFSKKHYDKILKALSISEDQLKDVMHEIITLNPKPGSNWSEQSSSNVNTVIPDFIVESYNGEVLMYLNNRNVPPLKVSREYAELLKGYANNKKGTTSETKEAVQFVKQKLDAAKWFIDAVRQRQETMERTMRAIIQLQYDFFLTEEDADLKPMILKDVADITGYDISTISRVTNSKYVQTNLKIYSLKYFFTESAQTDSGEEISTREVKRILHECIDNEDKTKPLTDDRLTEILQDKGYVIARRTIAKYREQLNIPVARLRKELK